MLLCKEKFKFELEERTQLSVLNWTFFPRVQTLIFLRGNSRWSYWTAVLVWKVYKFFWLCWELWISMCHLLLNGHFLIKHILVTYISAKNWVAGEGGGGTIAPLTPQVPTGLSWMHFQSCTTSTFILLQNKYVAALQTH